MVKLFLGKNNEVQV